MDRRPHPAHDRRVFRRALAGFAAAMLSLSVWLAADALGQPWAAWVGMPGFLAGAGWMVSASVNRTACPGCGRALRRGLDETLFPCAACGVAWETECFGGSNWDG